MATYKVSKYVQSDQPDLSITGGRKWNQVEISLDRSGGSYETGDYLDISILPPRHQITEVQLTLMTDHASLANLKGQYSLVVTSDEVGGDHGSNAIVVAKIAATGVGTAGSRATARADVDKDVPVVFTPQGGASRNNSINDTWIRAAGVDDYRALSLLIDTYHADDDNFSLRVGWEWRLQEDN